MNNDPTQQQPQAARKKLVDYWPVLAFVISVIFGAGILFNQVQTLQNSLDDLSQDVKEQKKSIEDIPGISAQIKALEEKVTSIDTRLRTAENEISILGGKDPKLVGLSASDSCRASIIRCMGELDLYVLTNASVQYSDVVAYNSSGDELLVEDVAYKKLLIPYKDQGKECFFYGQLDEDGKWDGDCIINIYENKRLKLITEAVYNNGELSTFQQAFPNESARQNGQNVWFFSNRAMKEGFSVGETWDYIREGDFKQTFSYDKVTADDILTIQELQSEVAVQLEGYYSGNTSGGRFNDDSGEAYMVKYFEDGTVRTLYKGKFENGFPEDSSNDGWMIGRSSMEDSYSHYVGPFKEGHPTISPHAPNAKDYWEIGISQDRIVELLEGKTFNCELLWSLPRV